MLSIYVGKEIVRVDEANLLDMDINVLKNIPYSIACKYNEYISSLEVCVEDCLNIPADVHDEASYMEALVELETIMENDKEEEVMIENNIVTESIVIDGVVVDGVVVEVENNTNNKEMSDMLENTAKEMANENLKGFDKVKDYFNKFSKASKKAQRNVFKEAKVTKEEFINRTDKDFNDLKEAFVNVLNTAGEITGLNALINSLSAIVEAGGDAKELSKMAKECRKEIDKEIKFIKDYGTEEDLKRILTFKASIENERGESIFEMLASACVNISTKVAEKFASWGAKGEEKNVFATICRSISTVASLLRKGVKIVFEATKFIASFAVASLIKLVDIVFNAFKLLFNKIKNKFTKDDDFIDDSEDDSEDEFFVEEE